ncbi:unnamed protein product [Rhizophagus irregularis]|uniref:Uncharacterized protein n=1 Tax=Rhizophagus irregularis TaxID=588596 RepID=A0A915Z033_9GLOM|nr:unnamed protein product [Rhizophagus irregularis]
MLNEAANSRQDNNNAHDLSQELSDWFSIATKYNTDYSDVDETYLNPNLVPLTTTWADQVKAVLKARQKHERAKMLAKQRTEISEAIEKRIQQIESDQSKWIDNSLKNQFLLIDC